jgi:phosphoenolpyruvate carboxylase
MKDDPIYGDFWKTLYAEYQITKEYLLKLSGTSKLMENYPVDRESILAREGIVLPLLVIQHFAIRALNSDQLTDAQREDYSKLIARTIFGVVNAGRNVA